MRRTLSKGDKWADHYTRKAQKEHFPARSVYKLQEIQSRFRLIRKGDRIVDLGCSPGSWLLYAADRVGNSGQVIGIDLKPVTVALPPQVRVLTADVFSLLDDAASALGAGFNGVISDMAPATTGIKGVDSARSHDLCAAALRLALQVLAPGGYFVCKIFQGADVETVAAAVKSEFHRFGRFKPKSSRKASKEIYLIGNERRDAGGSDVRSQQVVLDQT